MSERISAIQHHLLPGSTTLSSAGANAVLAKAPKSPDDVVIIEAIRSPLCKGGKGAFKETHPEYIMGEVFKALIKRTGIEPGIVQDIQVGNVCMPGAGVTTARMAALYGGFPNSVPACAVNRQCSSGLATVGAIAAAIKAGFIDIGIGVHVRFIICMLRQVNVHMKVLAYGPAADVLTPMGITSENVAEQFGVTRAEQDAFALRSHTLAAKAAKEGLFAEEIVPIKLPNGTVVSADDGIRLPTAEILAKLRPAFKPNGSSTAGNSSQVTDGAAAVLLCRRSYAEKKGLKPIARFLGFTAIGCPPTIMGIGPAVAIPAALQQVGLKLSEIGIWEINEAFASQAVYCVKKLGIPVEKVNPKGGAIAFGHPMGATGARQVATLLPELRRKKERFGVISMCVGIGMGVAAGKDILNILNIFAI
ncbi:3-ketoacyl-CoA thiolase, peroxisomal [Entophlyctis sp. JEL0112]|nr:3-ketoacyl-CoA thiolase, peroxisomal [Entophlyctis sp. JEL0112]